MTLSSLRQISLAPKKDTQKVSRWLDNLRFGIDADERKYLEHDEDLIRVTPDSKTPMRKLIDRSEFLATLRIWKDKHKEKHLPWFITEDVKYFSEKKIEAFATATILFLGVVMLIVPLWLLVIIKPMYAKLGTITAFVFVFLMTMAYILAEKPFQALSSAAALVDPGAYFHFLCTPRLTFISTRYAAVLMVFIQVSG